MKTLLQINATCNYGSTGRIAEQIGLLCEKNGWKCIIAHGGRYINKSSLDTIQISSKLDNYLHAILSRFLGAHGLGSILPTLKFIKKVKEINPDIIHLHNIHGYYLNYPILFKYLSSTNIPVVWTLHDCWSMTGHCTHFDSVGCQRWKTECYDCPLKNYGYKTIGLNCAKRNYRLKKKFFCSINNLTITSVSYWLENIVRQSYLSIYPSRVVNNGVNLEIFRPTLSDTKSRLGISEGISVLLGVASSWSSSKGLREFLKLSEMPEYKVVLVGVSDKLLKSLPPQVIGIKRTNSQAELAELYSMADVFVNPTYSDSFPTVNMEALACGTPVITYRTGGSPEILSAETGIVVPKGDFKALRDGIEQILSYNKTYYTAACVSRAQQLFNKDERFQDYVNLYLSLLNE